MPEQKTHKMHMGAKFPNGSQEWFCLECDRKILVQWEPVFKIRTIEIGDSTVVHTGSLGGAGLELASADVESQPKGIVQ